MTEPLSKVDSAVQGLSSSPPKEKAHRRASSAAAPGVYNVNDLGKPMPTVNQSCDKSYINSIVSEAEGIDLELAVETQKTGW